MASKGKDRPTSEFAERIAELREALGEGDAEMAERFGRAPKQIGVWRNGGQAPHDRTLRRVAERNGWPVAMFYDGGPRPATVVNQPVNAPTAGRSWKVAEPGQSAPYGALAAQGAAMMALAQYLAPGAPFNALTRILDTLYEAGRQVGRLERGGPPADRG